MYSFQTNHDDKILLFIVTLTIIYLVSWSKLKLPESYVLTVYTRGIYHLQVKTGNSGFPVWFRAIRLGGFRKYGPWFFLLFLVCSADLDIIFNRLFSGLPRQLLYFYVYAQEPSLFQTCRSWGQYKEIWAEKKTTRGRGESEGTPSFFSSLLFSRSLPSRRTPLSERLEQANKNRVGREVRVNGKQLRRTTTRKAKSRKINTWKTKARKTFKGSNLWRSQRF